MPLWDITQVPTKASLPPLLPPQPTKRVHREATTRTIARTDFIFFISSILLSKDGLSLPLRNGIVNLFRKIRNLSHRPLYRAEKATQPFCSQRSMTFNPLRARASATSAARESMTPEQRNTPPGAR